MNTTQLIPKLSSGASTLLVILLEQDRDRDLSNNTAFSLCVELAACLPSAAANPGTLSRLIKTKKAPATIFELGALLLDSIDTELAERARADLSRRIRSNWEHPAMLALGQAVLRAAGMTDAFGPPIAIALKKLSKVLPADLQMSVIQNYFGNLLQDAFDECGVRRNVRGLPPEAESDLRLNDAKAMAEWLRPQIFGAGGIVDNASLVEASKRLVVGLFLAEDK